jgi:ferredoxin-NADP reductase
MSLATSPTRPHLEYGVRVSQSGFKQAFAALQPEDSVIVPGPIGHYILDTSRPAVLVAGGTGITPLKGMAEYAADRNLSIPVPSGVQQSHRGRDRLSRRVGGAAA